MACAVVEDELELVTAEGRMPARIIRPSRGGPHPVVLICTGSAESGSNPYPMAHRLASAGYYVMSRVLDEPHPHGGDESSREGTSLHVLRVARDTEAMIRHLDADPAAMATEIGAVGYGLGGAFVIGVAAHEPARVRAVASFQGRQLVTDRDDSPHRLVRLVAAEMYFGFSECDESLDRADVERLTTALIQCSAPHQVEWHRTAAPDEVAAGARVDGGDGAERQWLRLLPLLGRRLPQPGCNEPR
jgi:carboxymethylenebutenolidase